LRLIHVADRHIDAAGGAQEALEFWSRWPSLPAVRAGRIVSIPQGVATLPGPHLDEALQTLVRSVRGPTADGDLIEAEQFVFACGPWLDRVCPDAMAGRLFVTRQEVVYFAVDRVRTGALPVWADLPFYGLPSLEGRGFKVANDTHGPEVDITDMDRRRSQETEAQARDFLARRFPSIAESPLSDSRVCQYANSSNGDFLIDRHPGLENVWLAGCGSGHGFKHGPALGAHLAGLVLGTERPIVRFSLESKQVRQRRKIQ
ncbi:MAG: FAD-dependent oxidoreductase, partial [Gemmatimonadota bacterium]